MSNYKQNNLNTWLNIQSSYDLSNEFGNYLPFPQKHRIVGDFITYCYFLEGFFKTNTNIVYLNDIVARIMITFPNANIRLESKYETSQETHFRGLKLKEFQNLKSIKSRVLNYEKSQKLDTSDQVFWALKLYFEQMITNNNLSYAHFEDFAFRNFMDRAKDKSTLKAKCRNIYNYYCERDFQVFCEYKRKLNDEEYLMTRQENMLKQSKARAQEARKKIFNLVGGMFAFEYKKNDKWNISKIARESKTSRDTVYKYIAEFETIKHS